MQESNHLSAATPSNRWAMTWNSVANNRLWFLLLMAFSVINIVVNPRPAVVAFGAIAGATLKPRKAFLAAIVIWLVWLINQYYDYSHSHHGHKLPDSWFFGVGLMGIEILVITALGAIRPTFSRITSRGHYVWMGIAVVVAFVLVEILVALLFLYFWPSSFWSAKSLTWAFVGQIFAFSLPKTAVSYLVFVPILTLIHFFFTRFTVRSTE